MLCWLLYDITGNEWVITCEFINHNVTLYVVGWLQLGNERPCHL